MSDSKETKHGREAEKLPSNTYAFHVYPMEDSREITLAEVWHRLWAGRWLIVLVTALFAAMGVTLALVMTPVYRGEILVSPVSNDSKNSSVSALASQFGGAASLVGLQANGGKPAEYIATLRSRSFTEKFIRDKQLMPLLFYGVWDEEKEAWAVPEEPTMWEAVRLFRSIRNISEDASTGLVTLTVDWIDPELAAEWANEMIALVNADLRAQTVRESQQKLEFLKGILDETSQIKLQNAVFSLMESEMKNAMLADVNQEFAFKILDPAVPPERHFRPNRMLLAILGVAVGGILSLLIVFLKQAFGRA